jgi:hypothetical protein
LTKKQNLCKKTFGANLYDLLHDGFFMQDGFMGKFAEKKITQIIDIIKLYKALQINGDFNKFIESYQAFFGKEAENDNSKIVYHIEKSKNKLFVLVDSIGEPVLRHKLSDELTSIFIKVEEKELKDIVSNLKNKNFDEIKRELKQYSNETREKILNQLFGNSHD